MRDTIRLVSSSHRSPLRSLRAFGAAVALAALVLLPALHGPHLGALDDASPTLPAGSIDGAPACPFCLFVAQARCAIATSAIPFSPLATLVEAREPITVGRLVAALFPAATPPRAPPV